MNWRHWTIRKLWNKAAADRDFGLRRIECRGLPYQICIESANICNTNCQLCPLGQGFRPRPTRGLIPVERFEAILDSIAWHAHSLGLYNWGEPLLHPRIFDMVRMAESRRLSTHISSNLHFIKPSFADDMIRSGLDLLIASVHAITQESYEAYQPGKDINEPLDAIRQIVRRKTELASRTPEVQLQFVVHRQNEAEVPRLVDFARSLGVTYVLTPVSLNLRFLDVDKEMCPLHRPHDAILSDIRKMFDEWLPRNEAFVNRYYAALRADLELYFARPKRIGACDWLWKRCIIAPDGDVMPCCGAYHQGERMGNILEEPLSKIWNGPRYQAARRAHARGEANDTPCAWCSGMLL